MNQTLVCLLAFGAGMTRMPGAEVSTLASRQATLDQAAKLLAPHAAPKGQVAEDAVNPFDPSEKANAAASSRKLERAPASSDREALEKIAASIKATGMMMMRGEPLLMVREKKLRIGDKLDYKLDGFDYEVVVTAIDSNSFRLRLNHEEVTRPIKSGKNP